MKKIILITAIIVGFASTSSAQSYGSDMKQVYSINYQMNIPLGGANDFTSTMSFEGININWAYFINPSLAVGVDLTYNRLHKKVGQKVYRPNDYTAINAVQYRYTQVFPLKAQMKYFFTPNNYVKAYAGVGIGALSSGKHIIVQDMEDWHNSWGFLVSPEIGMLIPFGRDLNYGVNVTLGYNYATNKSTFGTIKVNNYQSLYMNVGLYLAIF